MTHRIDPRNPTDVLYETARRYPGGVEAIAFRLGKSSSVLYKKLQRRDERHHLYFEEAIEIMDTCASARMPEACNALHAFAWRLDHVAVPITKLDDHTSSQLAEMVIAVFKEGGDVAAAIQKALDDGEITAPEAASIDVEIEQAIAALVTVRERVRKQAKGALTVVKSA